MDTLVAVLLILFVVGALFYFFVVHLGAEKKPTGVSDKKSDTATHKGPEHEAALENFRQTHARVRDAKKQVESLVEKDTDNATKALQRMMKR